VHPLSDAEKKEHLEALRQQTALAKFGELALRSDDVDEILTEACRLVGQALGTDLAKVVVPQEDGKALLVRAGVGWKPGVVGIATIKATDETSEGHAFKMGEPMTSPDIEADTRFVYPPFLTEHGVKAVANVPIIGAEGKPPFGILQIDSRELRQFTDEDITFMRSYANLLAAAVDRLHVIGDMRNAEARLRESLNRQTAALETGLIGFFEGHVPTNTITGDKQFANFYDLDPEATAAGVPLGTILALLSPDERGAADANLKAALASPTNFTREFRLIFADGRMRWLLVRGHCYEHEGGRPLHYTGTAVDVTASKTAEETLRRANEVLEAKVAGRTRELVEANAKLQAEAMERERVEEALRQAQKMEAVGQLTGGIAHDFNNLLAGISGSLELIRTRVAQGRTAELGRYLEVAMGSANRAAALTHRLLAFSRRQTLDPKLTDVTALVSGMEDLFRRSVGPSIQIETRLAGGLWPPLCDPNQLENALLNLVLNARDAMPEGGYLLIETANTVLHDRRATPRDMPTNLPPGDYMALCVTDTGTGMAPDVLARAFDPFFTTKPLGQGTGLGLSMTYGFVQQSGGQVHLRSKEGQGTTVTIYLPRHFGAIDGEAQVDTASGPVTAEASAVVLVVEDELAVRMIVVDVLSDHGYTVLEAGDGRSGLHIVASGVRIDLLLTDVGLPGGMNGRQLADVARQRRPGLKVLFMTGYDAGAAISSGLMDPGMQVMTKPFAMDALAARIQGMISIPDHP